MGAGTRAPPGRQHLLSGDRGQWPHQALRGADPAAVLQVGQEAHGCGFHRFTPLEHSLEAAACTQEADDAGCPGGETWVSGTGLGGGETSP